MNVLKNILSLHAQRYPAMEICDYVKLIYQNEFGIGHMVAENDVLEALRSEFSQAQDEGYSPPYAVEAIGGGLCRVHLDLAHLTEEDLPLLSRCIMQSSAPHGSMEGLWEKLGVFSGMVWAGELPLIPQEVELFLSLYESKGCPPLHHSDKFRELYHPHYRIMNRDLSFYAPALKAIDTLLRKTDEPVIVAVDGRCASGKTTFSRRAAELFSDCAVFHMDDFFLPPEKRTPERLAAPGGNVDYERAAEELFEPLRRGEAIAHRRFDCSTMTLEEPVGIPFHRLNIIEGSYVLTPALAAYPTLRIFFTCSPEKQQNRLARRETPEKLKKFQELWIPMEENYFRALCVEKQCDLVIDTSLLPQEEMP